MNNLKIAVCDDEEHTLCKIVEKVRTEFLKNGMNVEITKFNDPKLLIEISRENVYSAVFLDIDMPDINGIEVASIIKRFNPTSRIIFVTNMAEFIFDAVDIHFSSFIIKSEFSDKISNLVKEMKKEIQHKEHPIKFSIDGNIYKLRVDEVTFIKSSGNYISIRTADGSAYRYKDSINKKEIELSENGFVRTHESYLVNLKYVFKINRNTLTMVQGYDIPISRYRAKTIKECFLNYYGKSMLGGI